MKRLCYATGMFQSYGPVFTLIIRSTRSFIFDFETLNETLEVLNLILARIELRKYSTWIFMDIQPLLALFQAF